MPFHFSFREQTALFSTLAKGVFIGALIGVLSGVSSAFFLHTLNGATAFRETHPYLLYGLPLAGVAIVWLYERFGQSVAAGNNLLLEHIHEERTVAVPFRMAPLILLTTVATHFFGGSAGREGTAVQMGGTLSSLLAHPLKLSGRDRGLFLQAGISGGFGAVFGIPLAGTVFGLEVLSLGQLNYAALVPCFAAAYVGDITCRALGVTHAVYQIGVPVLTPFLWMLTIVASVLFGGAALLFSELTHAVVHVAHKVKPSLLPPFVGGAVIILLTELLGMHDYLGLSLPLIKASFTPRGIVLGAFALKMLFTVITLGTGFKGGEVTPLFCIGATLGAAFAQITHQPTGFFAALGFVAVFAGAANTPLACVFLGTELFGTKMAVPTLVACLIAYVVSGHRGIYPSQRIGVSKQHGQIFPPQTTLREIHQKP